MSELNAEQRGDMVEALMPEAAGLVVDVHEGSADDIRNRLSGLSRHELEALAVVLAAIADPDRTMTDALAWVTFDEHGEGIPPSWTTRSEKAVRDLAPQMRRDVAGVDLVAVNRAIASDSRGTVALTREERRLAIEVGLRRGLAYDVLAARLGMDPAVLKRSWERIKARARAEGRPVPVRGTGSFAVVA
jgi:hypothetical protein